MRVALARTRRASGGVIALGMSVVGVCASACRSAPVAPVTPITIATGGTGGVYYPLGETLARRYRASVPGVEPLVQATVASVFNVQAVHQGAAHLAFTQGDVAYLAYATGTAANPAPHTKLRGMAVLYVNFVQIVVRADSDVRTIRDLRGKRVGVGAPGSGTELAARIIIEAHGLRYRDVMPSSLSFAEAAARLETRSVDAAFLVASYPVAALAQTATRVGVRLLPVDAKIVSAIRAEYPFFKPVVLPRGTYRGLEHDVATIGVDNLLVCRADLPEDLVYQLTRVFFGSLPDLVRAHAAAAGIDPDRAPTTPIPLHAGAARYYRERELLK